MRATPANVGKVATSRAKQRPRSRRMHRSGAHYAGASPSAVAAASIRPPRDTAPSGGCRQAPVSEGAIYAEAIR